MLHCACVPAKWAGATLLGFAFALMSAGAAPAANLVVNGDFSASHPFNPEVTFLPSEPDAWGVYLSNSDAINAPSGSWFQNAAVIGSDAEFMASTSTNALLAIYNLGGVVQSFTVALAGAYSLTWDSAAPLDSTRKGNSVLGFPEVRALNLGVYIDGVEAFSLASPLGQSFVQRTVELDLTAGSHVLEFVGKDRGEAHRSGGANQYVFETVTHVALIDNVSIAAVPEVPTVMLMLAGLVGVGLGVRGRRFAGSR